MRFFEGMHRLHWVTALLKAPGVVVVVFVVAGYSLLLRQTATGMLLDLSPHSLSRFVLIMMPALVIGVMYGFWSWWALRFWIAKDDLVVATGIVRKRNRRVPLARIQAVDVVRPLVARVFGLAEVRVELAGGDQGEATFRYLGRPEAEQLRAELLARAAGLPGHTPEAPEHPFWRVRFGPLLGSHLLKLPVLGSLLLLVVLLVAAWVLRAPGLLVAAIIVALGLARGLVAPLIMHTNFRVALSPDGVRLRYGLMETRMQTVPPGRVQAVRVVEPALWRSYGWARLDVTVAGYVGDRQALSSVLLPIAPRGAAFHLVGLVFPRTNVEAVRLLPSSSRSWLRTPLQQPAAGTDDAVFVTRRGLLSHSIDVIAHARSQSVRLTANPLQRMLNLGTVHVDAPPGPVQVEAADRDLGEARAIVESAAERARRARASDARTGRWASS